MAECTDSTSSDVVEQAIAGEAALSEFWRKNTSYVEATELANVLRAMRKVAGNLGRNVGDIVYVGMTKSPSASIILDPDFVIGQYPVSPWKVDYLVGLVVHEALHRTEWTDLVWSGAEKASPNVMLSMQ